MLWIKDGVIFRGRLEINGRVSFVSGEPDPDLMRSLGWEEYTPPAPEPAPEPAPKRYSKRKIILALGDKWPAKKLEIETAGLWDLFENSTYLCADAPEFAAIYETLSDEEKRILDEECSYE